MILKVKLLEYINWVRGERLPYTQLSRFTRAVTTDYTNNQPLTDFIDLIKSSVITPVYTVSGNLISAVVKLDYKRTLVFRMSSYCLYHLEYTDVSTTKYYDKQYRRKPTIKECFYFYSLARAGKISID